MRKSLPESPARGRRVPFLRNRICPAIFSVLALTLIPSSLFAGDKLFNPDVTYFAADIDPTLFGPDDRAATIQTIRLILPEPNGFDALYANERAEFYYQDRIVLGVDFLPRRLIPAVGGHFKEARVALAALAAEDEYLNEMIAAAGFTGKAKVVRGAEIIQNTPRSIIVRIEVAPAGEDQDKPHPESHMDLLHGYFTIGSSLLEFHGVAARGEDGAPVGTAMFAAWLERLLQKNR